jgi:hypothetical protein
MVFPVVPSTMFVLDITKRTSVNYK